MLVFLLGLALAQCADPFDVQLAAELAAAAPAAVADWDVANTAREGGNHEAAVAAYTRVEAAAPGFFHATRRRCGSLLALGRPAEATLACEAALAAAATAENQAALAVVLLNSGEAPSVSQVDRARSLIAQAEAAKPDDPAIVGLRCQSLLAAEGTDPALLGACGKRLLALDGEVMLGHYLVAIAAGNDGEFATAHAELDRAHALGLPDEAYASLDDAIAEAEPVAPGVLRIAGIVALVWFGAMGLLFAAGAVLSRLTLRAAEAPPDGAGAAAGGLSSGLRTFYRAVLWLSCAFYYLSVPLVALAMVGMGGAVLYAVFAVGHIPIKLVLLVVVVVGVSVWALLKSLFVRVRDEDPGERLDLAQHPRLAGVLAEVAGKVGTRPVDTVFLTPGTDVAVFERGGLSAQLRGDSERCLILGVGVLDGFQMRPFKAVLAHEYGHFSNRDTAGGGFALAVRRSIMAAAAGLAEGGAAGGFNPAWWFLRGFHDVFLRISQGASRLQEVLADRWSAFTYGAAAFEAGLRHVITRSVGFGMHANATLREVIQGQRALANLYQYQPGVVAAPEEVGTEVDEALAREPGPFDSHPAPMQRFRWVHALGASGEASGADDDAPVWDLFSDREALERQMTDQIRANVAMQHSVAIPKE